MILFISDTHLGNHRSKADELCDFLESQNNDVLVALGDIIDDHQMRIWPTSHIKALSLMLSFKKIIYIPGNHDPFMRKYFGSYGNITITDHWIYQGNNKKYLVVHGDQFDPWIKATGFISQSWIAKISRWTVDHLHTKFVGFGGYRRRGIAYAKSLGFDGIICGHSHNPELSANFNNSGLDYLNTGSWVEECCTAITEKNGVFELYHSCMSLEIFQPSLFRSR